MSNKKEEQVLWRSITLIGLGLICLFALTRVLDVAGGLIAFYVGLTLLLFGLADVSIILYRNRKPLQTRIVHYHRKQMHRANHGVVWIWIICLAGICVYAIAFYVMVFPALQIIGIVEDLMTWDANATFTLNLARTVLNWHPIIFIVGLLLWAFVNSQRREDVTYPMY